MKKNKNKKTCSTARICQYIREISIAMFLHIQSDIYIYIYIYIVYIQTFNILQKRYN